MAFKNYEKKTEEVVNPYLTYKQAIKVRDKKRHKELLRDVSLAGRSDEEKERERILLSNPTSRTSYVFTSPRYHTAQNFHGIEYTEFTAYPSQPIIHGIITICEFDNDGQKTGEKSEDIYMYQPRFEGKNSFVVGPRFKSNGTLDNRAAYAYKDPSTGVIYVGSIPKREIISNRQFDFDSTNQENFSKACENLDIKHPRTNEIVSIKYDTDSTGLIKTVDMNNPKEKAQLDAYFRRYPTGALADDMIDSYINRIEKELKTFEKLSDEVNEAVERVGTSKRLQAAAEASASKASSTDTTTSLAEENAKMVNDMLKYGIRPTLSSPVNDGIGGLEISRPGKPPMGGGPRPGGMGGGPSGGPRPGGRGR